MNVHCAGNPHATKQECHKTYQAEETVEPVQYLAQALLAILNGFRADSCTAECLLLPLIKNSLLSGN